MLVTVPQVTWFPGPCTTSSRCTSRTPAMAPRSTRRAAPRYTGSPKPSTPCATSCTAHRWSGRTPTLSPPRSPCRLRGEHAVAHGYLLFNPFIITHHTMFDMSVRLVRWVMNYWWSKGEVALRLVSPDILASSCKPFTPRVFLKMQRGLDGADTSPGVEQIDGNNGDFTWLGGWTDSNIFPPRSGAKNSILLTLGSARSVRQSGMSSGSLVPQRGNFLFSILPKGWRQKKWAEEHSRI